MAKPSFDHTMLTKGENNGKNNKEGLPRNGFGNAGNFKTPSFFMVMGAITIYKIVIIKAGDSTCLSPVNCYSTVLPDDYNGR